MNEFFHGPKLIEDGIHKWVGYSCSKCKSTYSTIGEARGCYAQGFEPRFNPGDIVVQSYALETGHGEYGWFNGDSDWLMFDNPTGGMHDGRSVAFYYVVTAIELICEMREHDYRNDRGRHDPIYHVLTRACMNNAFRLPNYGWTNDNGHVHLSQAPNPPEKVIRQGRKFIGHKSTRLL